MKQIATVIAIVIALIGYIPYFKDTISGKTKPHIISWFTWSLLSLITFGVQLLNNGGVGSYVNLFMGLVCLAIVILGIKNGTKNVTKVDIIAFVLAIIAIILWLIVKQPILSLILVVFIDIMSFFPTFRKSWNHPWDETFITWILNCVRSALSIYALASITLTTVLYPAYSLISCALFCILLLVRRKVIKKL